MSSQTKDSVGVKPPYSIAAVWPLLLLAIASLAGAMDAWTYRHSMNPDGISYIDMAYDISEGRWLQVVNGHWSPMYPLVLAVALRSFHPDPSQIYPLVHLVNWIVFVATVLVVMWFSRALVNRLPGAQSGPLHQSSARRFPTANFLLTIHVGLFVLSIAKWINNGLVSPDMLVCFFVFLESCLFLRLIRRDGRMADCLAFGIVLGLGYLAKAPMFFFGALLLGGFTIVEIRRKRGMDRTLLCRTGVAAVSMIVVMSFWVVPLSLQKGKITIADSARLNYIWNVSDGFVGNLDHPVPVICEHPRVQAFGEPIVTTYSLWRDPSYWMSGAEYEFSAAGHFRQFVKSMNTLSGMINSDAFGILLIAVVAPMLLLVSRWRSLLSYSVSGPGLVLGLSSLAVVAMFSIVLIELRYVIGFLLIGWFVAIAFLFDHMSTRGQVLIGLIGLALFLSGLEHGVRLWSLLLVSVVWTLIEIVRSQQKIVPRANWRVGGASVAALALAVVVIVEHSNVRSRNHESSISDVQIATRLRAAGVTPGDNIVILGGPSYGMYWTRLAGIRIVAEMERSEWDAFDSLSNDQMRGLILEMKRSGARWIVSQRPIQKDVLVSQEIAPSVHLYSLERRPLGLGEIAYSTFAQKILVRKMSRDAAVGKD